MIVDLYQHQKEAMGKLRSGSILCGGVGSGKSRTALAYFYTKILGGSITTKANGIQNFVDLYIITTAQKRDKREWDAECSNFGIAREGTRIKVVIDSWNNISKYVDVFGAFFIFDEQRVVGSGQWAKSFIKIAKSNKWILLSATPGDGWMDYVPVFIANGFYRNRTEFLKRHVIFSRFSKYPKVDRFIETKYLEKLRSSILVDMPMERSTEYVHNRVITEYDRKQYDFVVKMRFNIFKDEPIPDAGSLCLVLREIVNSDVSKIDAIKKIISERHKLIVFYNYNYELDMLRRLNIKYSEWNGQKHEPIPEGDEWAYLVQYNAGAEGWNCITTDTIVFFSKNYSYKLMTQAAGRIDRLNTPYKTLYYYYLETTSPIDRAIAKALANKKNFNEKAFAKF